MGGGGAWPSRHQTMLPQHVVRLMAAASFAVVTVAGCALAIGIAIGIKFQRQRAFRESAGADF